MLYQKVASQVGPAEAAIFHAHESILHDPAFTAKIRTWIVDECQSAQGRCIGFWRNTPRFFREHARRLYQGAASGCTRRGDPP